MITCYILFHVIGPCGSLPAWTQTAGMLRCCSRKTQGGESSRAGVAVNENIEAYRLPLAIAILHPTIDIADPASSIRCTSQ